MHIYLDFDACQQGFYFYIFINLFVPEQKNLLEAHNIWILAKEVICIQTSAKLSVVHLVEKGVDAIPLYPLFVSWTSPVFAYSASLCHPPLQRMSLELGHCISIAE